MAKWGAIFDFDGVIIDSADYHEASWERLAKEENKTLPLDHFKKGFGRKNTYIIPEILQWARDDEEIDRLGRRKEALYREIIEERGIEPLPGVRAWLEILARTQVPCVIGSSTERRNLECVLKATGLLSYFADLVSADDVTAGKPDPQVFLQAASKISMSPSQCLVFEDAHVGIEAARAAEMKVIAVATTHPEQELSTADRVVHRLDELDAAEIGLWLSTTQ